MLWFRRTAPAALAVVAAAWCIHAAAQTSPPAARQVKQRRSIDDKRPLQLFPVATLWTLALNNALTAAPAFDGKRAYFPIEGDQLAAYDLIDGRQLWIAPVRTTAEPVVGQGLVLVFEPESLVALRVEDGTVAWHTPHVDTLAVPPSLAGDWLVTATTSGDIVARRPNDGVVVWRQQLKAPAHARPEITGTRVFVPTSDSLVVALDSRTGAPLWERKLGKNGNEILAAGNRLYLGSEDRYFYCLNAGTGVVEWRWATGANVIGRPVVDEPTVYFVALDNVLRALNVSNGVQRWKSPLPLRPITGPLKWSQTLVVTGTTPGLQAYNAADGKTAGQVSTASELSAPPYLLNDSSRPFPVLLAVTSDITGRATVTAWTRTVEPEITAMAALPNAFVPPAPGEPPKDLGPVTPLPSLSPVSPEIGP
jgi:outer membrane protein assembly factor BamB